MEIENEHLTEIPHLGVLRVRSKSGEVFCLDAVALDGEGIHQHRTEAPFVGIVTKTDMMVELAILQRLAPEVIAARGHLSEELPTLVHAHDTCANTRIEMLVRVRIAKAHIVIGERCNREDQFVLQQAHLHTRSHLQTMEAAVVGVGAYRVRLTVNQLLVRLVHDRFVVVRVVRPDIQIDILGLPRQLHLIGNEHNRFQVRITFPNLVFVNLLRHVRHRRKGRLVTGHVALVFPEHALAEIVTHRQLRTGNPVRRFLTALLDIRVHSTDTHSVRKLLDALLHFRKSVGLGGGLTVASALPR